MVTAKSEAIATVLREIDSLMETEDQHLCCIQRVSSQHWSLRFTHPETGAFELYTFLVENNKLMIYYDAKLLKMLEL